MAADIATYLPPNTLSGIVYLCGLLRTKAFGLTTPLAFKYGSVLRNPEASAEAVQAATLGFSNGIFDLQSEVDAGSELDLKSRRLRRWGVQSTWLGYGVHQTANHRSLVSSRDQDISSLYALGSEGFPVLVVHGAQDALVNPRAVIEESQKHFTNLRVVLIEDGGSHAVFHENPDEVMKNIGEFANEVWVNVR